MKKIVTLIVSIIIIFIIIFFSKIKFFNENEFIKNFEKDNDVKVILNNISDWNFYPHISYSNNITVSNNANFLKINNADIKISKKYWPYSPINIDLTSPSIRLEDIKLLNVTTEAVYTNNNIIINKFDSYLQEGNLTFQGEISLENDSTFDIYGSLKNVPLNILLQQAKIAIWDRIQIKITSSNFNISGTTEKNINYIKNLKGVFPISGSLFFASTEEERFGAALLSLFVNKLPSLSSISDPINYLLSKFGDIPSDISGTIIIDNGLIITHDLEIKNNLDYALIKANLDIKKNIINGKIIFYENNKIFLETTLQGNLNDPQILIGGNSISQKKDQLPRDIKKIFEEGIHSLLNMLLEIDE